MHTTSPDLEAVIPQQEFIKTVCGSHNIYVTRDELIALIKDCGSVRIKAGVLHVPYGDWVIKAKARINGE